MTIKHDNSTHLLTSTIATMKTFSTIYFVKGNSITDSRSAFVSYSKKCDIYTACTTVQSRDYMTLKGALAWMAKKGYTKPLVNTY